MEQPACGRTGNVWTSPGLAGTAGPLLRQWNERGVKVCVGAMQSAGFSGEVAQRGGYSNRII